MIPQFLRRNSLTDFFKNLFSIYQSTQCNTLLQDHHEALMNLKKHGFKFELLRNLGTIQSIHKHTLHQSRQPVKN